MKPGKINLILCLVIAVFAGLIYVLEVRSPVVQAEKNDAVEFLSVPPESVTFLRLERGTDVLELQKEGEEWRTVVPYRDRASRSLVQAIVDGLSQVKLKPVSRELQSRDPAELGFDQSQFSVEVGDVANRSRWLVGKSLPLQEGGYVKDTQEEKIYLVEQDLSSLVPPEWDVFRQRTLFRGVPDRVKRFELRGGSNPIQCVRKDSGHWMMVQPFSGLADDISVQEYLEALYALRIQNFIADQVSDPGIYGIVELSPEIRLYSRESVDPDIIRIGSELKNGGGVYASDPSRSSVFTLPMSVVDLVTADPSLFQDHRPIPHSASQARELGITHDGQTVELRNQNGGWVLSAPTKREASADKVNTFFEVWTSTVIREFVDISDRSETNGLTPLIQLSAKFAARDTQALVPADVELYKDASSDLYLLRRVQDETWGRVPKALLEASMARPLHFYTLRMLSLDPDSVQQYVLVRGGETQTISRTDSGAFVAEDAVVDLDQVKLLENLLSPLTSVAVVDESVELAPSAYFDEDYDQLVIKLKSSVGISKTLMMGKYTQNSSRYAKVLGDPVIYLLSQEQSAQLQASLYMLEVESVD